MKRTWAICLVVLVAVYAMMAVPNIPAALRAKRIASGMTYREFALPFKKIDSNWTEEQVVATFGRPSLVLTNKAGARGLEYRWNSVRIDLLLQPYSSQSGGVNIWFKDGKMFATGWSDKVD